MKKAFSILLFLLPAMLTLAQEIEGKWYGMLKVGTNQLRLVFHISKSDTGYTATMDSPDQNATGIPVGSTTFDPPRLSIELSNLRIQFRGELKDNKIPGMFTQNGQSFPLELTREEIEKKKIRRPQEPVKPYPYKEEEVVFHNAKANIELAGTLTLPPGKGSYPAVILISGSGPQDRDESLMEHKPFLVLADHLTRSGIAVLRYDDRGVAKSKGQFTSATIYDFAADAEAALAYLKTRPEINSKKIGLVGHSEGGMVAPMVAAASKDVGFIVLLAGTGVRGDRLLLSQQQKIGKASGVPDTVLARSRDLNSKVFEMVLNASDSTQLASGLTQFIRTYLNQLPESEKPGGISLDEYTRRLVNEVTSPWFQSFIRYDPATSLKKVKCSVLAINGEKDLQVPATENLAAIGKALGKAGNKDVTLQVFPKLNHLFQEAQTGLPAEYPQIEQTFSPGALAFITNWIQTRTKTK